MPIPPLFFALSLLDNIRHWFVGKDGSVTMLVFFAAAALVALLVFGWAVMIRKQTRHHTLKPAQSSGGGHARSGGLFSRHKHRRKKHRPTNPTRAETGGLPAPRDSKIPPKSPL